MANIVPRENQPTSHARRTSEWDPFELMRDFLQFTPFQAFPRRWLSSDVGSAFAPRFDVREDRDSFVIKADMPGIKAPDVDISLTGNRLCISGQRQEERNEESRAYTRERSFGSFSRDFTLPETTDPDHIDARMQDGVLEVKVPKRAESQPKKIPLSASNGDSSNGERASKRAPSEGGVHQPRKRSNHAAGHGRGHGRR